MSTVFTTLPGHPHSVGAARHFVTACLRACPVGVPNEITEAVELVVSELVTNALHHTRTGTPGGTFSVRVETTPCRVRGEVHSGAPLHQHDTPHVFQADPGGLAEGGRGPGPGRPAHHPLGQPAPLPRRLLPPPLAHPKGLTEALHKQPEPSMRRWRPDPPLVASLQQPHERGRGRFPPRPRPPHFPVNPLLECWSSMTDDFVTLYAGPLDGLTVTRTHLDTLAQDHGDERFLLLTHCGASGLYQQTEDRWIYAAPGLLNHNDNTQGDTREEAP